MSKKSKKKSPKKKVSAKKSKGAKKKVVKKKSVKKTVSKKPAKSKKAKPARKKVAAKKPVKKKKIAPKKSKAKKQVAPKKVVKAKISKKISAPVKTIAAPKVIAKAVELKPVKAEPTVKVKTPVAKKAKAVVKSTPITPAKRNVIIDIKTGPEPAGRFELEYIVHASAPILFEFLTSPSGLSEWFCDDLNIRNGIYTFKWEENEQQARVVKLIHEKQVRFQWIDKQDNSYFEFRVERDELTNDISLIVVDFAETAEERASTTLLWNSQVAKLLHVLGSYF